MNGSLPMLVWPIALTLLRRIGESVKERRRGSNRPHKGIDLFAPVGTAVLAAYPGIVLRSVDGTREGASEGQRRAGVFVDILGADGNVYRYLHLGGRPSVVRGQTISFGTKIGEVGISGVEHSGPHIHFEIRTSDYNYDRQDYGPPIDPLVRLPVADLGGPNVQPEPRSDADIALAYLREQGWSEQAARQLLQQRAQTPGAMTVEQQLLRIGWSPSEVRALLAGPPKRGTAEGFLDRVKGSTPQVRAEFDEVLRQAGIGTLDLPTSSDQPSSGATVSSLVKAFGALPQAQQLRLLAQLRETGGKEKQGSGSPDLSYLPVIKSGVEALTQIIKTIGKTLPSGGGGDNGGKTTPSGGDDLPPVIQDKDYEPFPEDSDGDLPPPIVADDDKSDVPTDSVPDSDTGSTSEPD